MAIDLLRTCHTTAIKDFVVAQEKHQDGSKHLHAFLRYESRVLWSSTRWDLAGYHGNYQVAKSWSNVVAYCTKENNYVANIDVVNAKSKKAARNIQLLEEDTQDLIRTGSLGLLQLPSLIKAKAAYSLLGQALQTQDVRGIWVYGISGVGKSHYVRTRFTDLFVKAQNKWWDGYTGQSIVLLDDFDHLGVCLSHYLKIWADKWASTGEIKGATVPLRHTAFYVTSQYSIDELWPGPEHADVREALHRRFRKVYIHSRDNIEELHN